MLFTGVTSIDLISFHDCLKQVPNTLIILNVMNNALELLAAESKSSAHLVIPLLHHMDKIFADMEERLPAQDGKESNDHRGKRVRMDIEGEEDDCDYEEEEEEDNDDVLFPFDDLEGEVGETSIAKLILKCFRYDLKKGCLHVCGAEEEIFKAAACCYPHLKDYSKKVFDDCVTVGVKKYNEVMDGQVVPRMCKEMEDCLEWAMGMYYEDPHDENDSPFRKALLYSKDGAKSICLSGDQGLVVDDEFRTYLNMRPTQLKKASTSVSRAKANGNSTRTSLDYEKEIAFINMLERIKRTRKMETIPLKYKTENMGGVEDCLACLCENEKVNTLHDMVFDRLQVYKPDSYEIISKWLESCLHYPATESACERFFRQLSLVVKKPGRTNMSPEKICEIAFLHNYAEEIYYLLGKGKKKDIDYHRVMIRDL